MGVTCGRVVDHAREQARRWFCTVVNSAGACRHPPQTSNDERETDMWNQIRSPKERGPLEQAVQPIGRAVDVTPTSGVGKSVVIKGEMTGDEDVTIDGRFEGRLDLGGHLMIGPNGLVSAHVAARSITIMGTVVGNLTATELVVIRRGGSVDGDIDAPKVAMLDGSVLYGRIDTLSNGPTRTALPLAG
jgi:cytoskeletal protein CcmA (bactofilin family)